MHDSKPLASLRHQAGTILIGVVAGGIAVAFHAATLPQSLIPRRPVKVY